MNNQNSNKNQIYTKTIEKLLDISVSASYNNIREPWRFVIFIEDGKDYFSEMLINSLNQNDYEIYKDTMMNIINDMSAIVIIIGQFNNNQEEITDVFSSSANLIDNFQTLLQNKDMKLILKNQIYMYNNNINKYIGLKYNEKIAGIFLCDNIKETSNKRYKNANKYIEIIDKKVLKKAL